LVELGSSYVKHSYSQVVQQDAKRIEQELQESQREKNERKHIKEREAQRQGKATFLFDL
jgi:hypothetical protein